jgi:DNA polymerase-3 subunit epsilon
MPIFTAIDFETADYRRDSACAVAAVCVENKRIVHRYHTLIRPPRRTFVFTYLHGISWDDVRDGPAFAEIWPELRDLISRSDFLVAHNAGFDRSVLSACCEAAGLTATEQSFVCTIQLARQVWSLSSYALPAVCEHLGIPLRHHDALSDAEACARIAIETMKAGTFP